MGVDFGLSETAMVGMAMSAAAMASNVAAQMKRKNEIDAITKRTHAQTDQLQQQAQNVWNKTLDASTPEARDKMIADEQAKAQGQYGTLVGPDSDALPGQPIVKFTSNSPEIVKTEAAKQLGTHLDKAKQELLARSRLQGYDRASTDRGIDLLHSGQQIGQTADFIRGNQTAQNLDIQKWQGAQPDVPVSDIASGVGGMLMSAPSGPVDDTTAAPTGRTLPPNWYKAYMKDGQIYSPF